MIKKKNFFHHSQPCLFIYLNSKNNKKINDYLCHCQNNNNIDFIIIIIEEKKLSIENLCKYKDR